jgi:Big-like domain-containing protein
VLGDGPTVLNVERMGVHEQSTTLVLKFNQPLDPVRAESLDNYQLTSAQGRPIRILQADYDSSAATVTLYPVVRLSLRGRYKLTVNGTGDGLTDTSGLLLDGAGTGQPGSNYVTVTRRRRRSTQR